MKTRTCLFVVSALLAMCSTIQADMLTFDDVSDTTYAATIPDGYGGFNWDGFQVLYGPAFPGYGYDQGRLSGDYTACLLMLPYGGYQTGEISLDLGTTFDFNRAYLTSHIMSGGDVQVLGYLDGTLMYDRTVGPLTGPQWYEFNFVNIDELLFVPQCIMVMDNFTFNEPVAPVPIPGAALLGSLGLSVAGWRLRRRTV